MKGALGLAMISAALLSIPGTAQGIASSTWTQTRSPGWFTHGRNSEHTASSATPSQALRHIHWQSKIDLHPKLTTGELFIHYGSPLITPANTVILPVRDEKQRFRLEAREGADGELIWAVTIGFRPVPAAFTPSYGPVLRNDSAVVFPEAGAVIGVRDEADHAEGAIHRLVFYGADSYHANKSVYDKYVMINTPLTVDDTGNVFFGFEVTGQTPEALQSGIARVSPDGKGIWVSAATASNDPNIQKLATNSAPALSQDRTGLYVVTNSAAFGYGYLLRLDSETLTTAGRIRLRDPSSGQDSIVPDISSSTPMIGPDGDVYFGVWENPYPSHNGRGWLLHFNGALTEEKIPGSFGWDDTASVVLASSVGSYSGKSEYLVVTKYNNYADLGGDGVNKLAVLDPNASMNDPILTLPKVMREVITIASPTPDPNHPELPGAVREWCINTAAVDPFTKSVLANNEDGKLYRWDLLHNRFSETITLTNGIGEAYTPTLIGADGTVYAINDAIAFAVGY